MQWDIIDVILRTPVQTRKQLNCYKITDKDIIIFGKSLVKYRV